MKKIIIAILSMMLIFSWGLADEYIPDLTMSSKKIISMNNEKIMGMFEVKNNTGMYNPDIYYIVSLNIMRPVVAGHELINDFKFHEYEPVKIDIGANETKNVIFELKIPENIPLNQYSLSIKLYTRTMPIGYETYMDIGTLGDQEEFLDRADYEHWKIGNKLEGALWGPNISKEKPKGVVALKSAFEEDKKIIPQYTIYKRLQTYLEEPMNVLLGDELIIKAGEEKEFNLDFPIYSEPESYLVHLVFLDEDGKQLSSIYEFRYVKTGVSAKILSMNSNYDEDNEKINVSMKVIGPADATDIKDAIISYKIYNSADDSLIKQKTITRTLTKEEMIIDEDIDVKSVIEDVKVVIEIKNNDDVLDSVSNIIKISKLDKQKDMFVDLPETKYFDAVKILNGFNILNGYPDGTFKPYNSITRAEFTVIATKLAKLDVADIMSEELRFSDVASEHWAKNFIILAYENGIISGYTDGTFKPDNNVTYQEALTILLNVMGYKWDVTKLNLNWPQGYIQIANELGMMSEIGEVDYATSANRGDVALLTLFSYLHLNDK